MINVKKISDNFPKLITILFCVVVIFMLGFFVKILELDKTIESFEYKTLDWRFNKTYNSQKVDENIVLVVYDNVSKQKVQLNRDVKLTTFLEPDEVVAKLINYIADSGAKYIVFNAKFEDSDYKQNVDPAFLNAVINAGNVYFPVVFSNSDKSLYLEMNKKFVKKYQKVINDPAIKRLVIDTWKTNLYKFNLLSLSNLLAKYKIEINDSDLFSTFSYKNDITFNSFNPLFKEVLEACKGVGSTNIALSDDGVLRNIYPYVQYKSNFYPSLALAVAIDYFKDKNDSRLSFLQNGNLKFGERVFPINDKGGLLVKWMGPTGTYKHYRIYDILNKNASSESQKISPEMFKDKIVLIGETHSTINILTNPLSRSISGLEVQANIIDNFINNRQFIYKINPIWDVFLTIIFSVLILFALIKLRSGFSVALVYLFLVALYILIALILFDMYGIWVYVIYPITIITVIFIIAFLVRYSILSKIYEETYQTAIKDGLTNLYNHKYFYEIIHEVISNTRGYQDKFVILMLDIDYFKKFNDNYGHRAGDKALRQVAQIIKKNVRPSDFVARYGGEEIAIILFRINYDDAVNFANRLVKTIHDIPFIIDDNIQARITVSIGVAHFPKHGNTPSDIIEAADKALYQAKSNGRDQVGVIDEPVLNQE